MQTKNRILQEQLEVAFADVPVWHERHKKAWEYSGTEAEYFAELDIVDGNDADVVGEKNNEWEQFIEM